MTEELQRLKNRIDTRLNDYLCEMKEGYDGSIVGFNEAWDIVRKVFEDEFKDIKEQEYKKEVSERHG